jgi:hypothetical protein
MLCFEILGWLLDTLSLIILVYRCPGNEFNGESMNEFIWYMISSFFLSARSKLGRKIYYLSRLYLCHCFLHISSVRGSRLSWLRCVDWLRCIFLWTIFKILKKQLRLKRFHQQEFDDIRQWFHGSMIFSWLLIPTIYASECHQLGIFFKDLCWGF